MPSFATQREALDFMRQTAEAIVTGTVDPYRGGSDLWHAALLLRDRSFRLLMPFAEHTDVLDLPQRFTEAELEQARAGIIDAAKALLDDEAFWR